MVKGQVATQPQAAIQGTANADRLNGTAGVDVMNGGAGNDLLRGRGYDTLSQIEVLRFLDGRLSFDTSDPTSTVFRLYDVAFDRAPDVFGLADYARALNEGRATVQSILNAFAGSAEFPTSAG